MAEYNFREVEEKWQKAWADQGVYQADNQSDKPKFYVLDMFPYPSGAGLHVGHPLGYIASDIVSRYKRLIGFNVLHPMGFDSFGLPAEQYAIQTGQHPAITTEENIKRYKKQLKNIGFSFDWDREVQTHTPRYYRWTQWIFMQLFDSWYNKNTDKAEPIETLVATFKTQGNHTVNAVCDDDTPLFTGADWNSWSEEEQFNILLHYRLTFPSEAVVNWCAALGTVLANDEVKDGVSERGGHPVERKKMKQWMMRITAYADRLLKNLQELDWSDPMKDMQTNWIGKSYGCELQFKVDDSDRVLTAFTTRPDTIYGATFMVIAPEHEWIDELTTPGQEAIVKEYVNAAVNRSERERQMDVKSVTGVFTGSYAINPFNQEPIPIWVADYVLAGYGTGVVMAVPSSDDRDFRFAKHFDLPVRLVIDGTQDMDDPTEKKHGVMINSGILDGVDSKDAINKAIDHAENEGFGKAKVNFKMRDAVFSRQRYWGEPVPAYFKGDIPYLVDEEDLPLELPAIDQYKPTETGEPPLGRAKDWTYKGHPLELTTMPGWAASSWYFLRYMNPANEQEFAKKEAVDYWGQVDLYLGGTEHATGHLLYSRFWNMFLYDRGWISHEEPFKKLINQGMIQGRSNFVYRLVLKNTLPEDAEPTLSPQIFLSKGIVDRIEKSSLTKAEKDIIEKLVKESVDQFNQENKTTWFVDDITQQKITPMHVDISLVRNDVLNVEAFKNWRPELQEAIIIPEADQDYLCGYEIEKMSKRYYNVVNPDDIVERYGADTLRLYEMFLGPLEQFKPWNTNGIDGVFKFLRKLWHLFHNNQGEFIVSNDAPTPQELKILHKTIKKAQEDIENYSFNTSVSEFMICVNELTALKCHKREVLQDLVVIISPYAPHIAEELWHKLGNTDSVTKTAFPTFDPGFLVESEHEYPVSVNGKMRAKMSFPLDMPKEDIEKQVLASEAIQKWLDGKDPKKVIVVPKKIVNVVV